MTGKTFSIFAMIVTGIIWAHSLEAAQIQARPYLSAIIPDIKINGSDGPVTLNWPDTLSINVSLNNQGITDEADWWLAADTPFGTWFYLYDTGQWTTDWIPAYQGALFNLPSLQILSIPLSGLPAGPYTLYFGIDTVQDRQVTWDHLFLNTAEFEIRNAQAAGRNDEAVQVTHDLPESAQNPVFSPDDSSILYTRFMNGYNSGPSELVKVRIDGSHEQIIVPAAGADNVNVPFGSWIGNKICFSSDRAGEADEIWMVNDDGSGLTQLTSHSEDDEVYYIEPVFNPENTNLIVFEYVRGENDSTAVHQIALLKIKSGDIALLTHGQFDDRLPSWSNDGKKIVFQRKEYGQDEGWSIYIADMDINASEPLSNIRAISPGISDDTDCSWSTDGHYVLSSSNYGGLPVPNVFMFPVDAASLPVRETFCSLSEDGAPSQSHNGAWIAFESHKGDSEDMSSQIWIIKAAR